MEGRMNLIRIVRKFAWSLALVVVNVSSVCGADQPTLLESHDVNRIMNQILQKHVEQKDMNKEVIARSFHIFIDQFDPLKLYLLESEVAPYLNPSDQLLKQTVKDYEVGNLKAYYDLLTLCQNSIRRARGWRDTMQKNSTAVITSALKFDPNQIEEDPKWATSATVLQRRMWEQLIRFGKMQVSKIGEKSVKGKEKSIISLYERNLRSMENEYLLENENGAPLTAQIKENEFVLRVLKAMSKSLDAHTAFYSSSEAYDMKVRLEKGFQGIGVVLQESIDGVLITKLIDGGPAAKSGKLQVNDRIISIDGISVVDMPFDKVLDVIRGEEGSTINLVIKRVEVVNAKEALSQFKVSLQREAITLDDERVDIAYEQYEDGIIGTLTLHAFYESNNGISSVRDMREALRELNRAGKLKGLILDLRDNTGGFLMQAVKVAGLFISNGVVVVSKYSDGQIRYFRDIDGYSYYDGPMVVLTSKGSASAAEIVAQALQDYGVALVVGDERTYGKGSIQHQNVTDGASSSFYKVTVGRYYTVSGKSTQIKGVKADIVVPTTLSKEKLGEEFLDYPLIADKVQPSYDDLLADMDDEAKQWYRRHYTPSIQKKNPLWYEHLNMLKENSRARIAANQDYQLFLKALDDRALREQLIAKEEKAPDYPQKEALNIIKDMIELVETSPSYSIH
jgi:carboxyl-terminal processing protease